MDPKRYYKRWVRAAIELCGDPTSLTLTLKDGKTEYHIYLIERDVRVITYVKLRGWGWTWTEDRRWKSLEPETKKAIGELAYQKILEMIQVREEIAREVATQTLEKPIGRVGEVSWSRGERHSSPFFDTVDEILPEEVRGSLGIRGGVDWSEDRGYEMSF